MRFFDIACSARGLAAIFGVAFLASCTVEGPAPLPGPGPMPPPGQRFCTRDYRPVCARRGDELRTFSNSCEADRAGFRVSHSGQCRSGGQWGSGPGSSGQWRPRPPRPGPEERPVACTREYRPVCATRRGQLRSFGNACEARAADFRIVDPTGRC